MHDFFAFLNEPLVLWGLLSAGVVLVLADYYFPVDWPAFAGYACFSLFFGATAPVDTSTSVLLTIGAFVGLLLLHAFCLSYFLTNAPRFERLPESGVGGAPAERVRDADEDA